MLAFLFGCQAGKGGSGWLAPPAAGAVAVGDWNDVHAAVLVAVGQNEAAILTWNSTDTEQVFQLTTINEQEGRLVARRDAAMAAPGPSPIHLSCTIGPFGNERVERALLSATRSRLEDLAGVDYRPLR